MISPSVHMRTRLATIRVAGRVGGFGLVSPKDLICRQPGALGLSSFCSARHKSGAAVAVAADVDVDVDMDCGCGLRTVDTLQHSAVLLTFNMSPQAC